ncbi:helix-turn-helix domain-containing protein [Knoellia aerolata]|uniref:XRE family transcriptional regulator n=1 Tax=Knoellia aerolata DSM 18566 TaxID=1385519 RepID=A0A0A0JTR7_9MICO|nr:XRE family transcriptional regulator [Knoellia aerolata]KGN40825.1 XRE family transcriptional regulator [Knoellia aerolata DSM 18566]
MSNERLRSAIVESGMSLAEFGDAVGVDPKTVERWITRDRVPHRAHRLKSAGVLGRTDVFLWPTTESDPRSLAAAKAEFVDLYPNRGSVPSSTWVELLDSAHESIDLLAYAGSFLHDSVPSFADRLSERVAEGVCVRLLFGDPTSEAVALRGREEGIGELMAARCSLTWNYLAPILNGGVVAGGPAGENDDAGGGVQARQHGCTLYASLFRFDDALLVNPHTYGVAAGHSPVLHLNRVPGGRLFTHYLESFDRTWQQAQPLSSA